jgi:hypothetical protein
MAISEGGVITGFLTCVEIGSASCSGGMQGWRYIEWQYNEGTLYIEEILKICWKKQGRVVYMNILVSVSRFKFKGWPSKATIRDQGFDMGGIVKIIGNITARS